MKKTTVVLFNTAHAPYKEGDIAGFAHDEANKFIVAGVAVKYEGKVKKQVESGDDDTQNTEKQESGENDTAMHAAPQDKAVRGKRTRNK